MSKMNTTNLPFMIKLESEYYAPEDSEWQEECRKLYMRIKDALDEGTVEPVKVKKEEEGHRGPIELEMFNTFIAHIVVTSSIAGLKTIFDLTKLWLENRKGAEVVLKFADGSEMKVSGASKDDIVSLYEKHSAGKVSK